jgi:hypothetical protein
MDRKEAAMTEREHWMNDVTSVRQMRDELRLKANLLRADLRDQWDRLEEQWGKLERDLRPVGDAIGTTIEQLDSSTREVLKTVRAGYARIREAVRTAV